MTRVRGKRSGMVGFSEEPDHFIANMFKPAEIMDVQFGGDDGPVTVLVPEKSDVGLAIGKGRSTIEKARQLVRRFYCKDIGNIAVPGDAETT